MKELNNSPAKDGEIAKSMSTEQENKQLIALLENSTDFIAMASLDGTVQFVNKAGRELVGLDQDEDLSSKTIKDFLTKEGLEASQKIEVPAVTRDGSWSGESTLRHFKTGQEIPVEINSFLIFDEEKKPIGLGTIQHEATQKIAAKEALKNSQKIAENQLKELEHYYKTAPVGLSLVDTNLRYLRINEVLANINDRPLDSHIGETLETMIPELAPILLPIYKQVLETGEPVLNLEVTAPKPGTKDEIGDWIGNFHPYFSKEGAIAGVTTVVQEVTELKQAQNELKKSEERYRAIIENSGDNIFTIDTNGVIQDINHTAPGLSKESVVGEHIVDLQPGKEDKKVLEKALDDVFDLQKGSTFDTSYPAENGFIYYSTSISPMILDGQVVGATLISRDVTDQRKEEKRLRQSSRVQAILDKSSEISMTGTWELDLETSKLSWSDMTKKIHEVSWNYEPQLESAINYYAEGYSREKITEVVNRAIEFAEQHDVELEIVTAKGNTKQVRAIIIPEQEKGKVVRLLGVFQDLTEQKERLRKTTRVQTILDKASEISMTGTWELDLITSELTWSDVTKKIHEVESDYVPLLDTAINFYAAGHSRDKITEVVQKAIEFGEQYDVELEIISARNNTKQVRAIGIPEMEDGKVVRLLGVFQDLTEHEMRVRQSNRVQTILDKSSEISKTGTWELDLITSELSWSDVTKKIHEVPLDFEPQLETAINYYAEGYSRDRISEVVTRAIEQGEQYDVELQIISAKNNIKQVRAIGIPEMEEGKVVRLLGVFQDQTEQKKMEQQLRENEVDLESRIMERTLEIQDKNAELSLVNDQLQQTNNQLVETLEKLKAAQSRLVESEKMASLGVLTAGIAHEINNPVNFIYGGINSLEENLKDVQEVLDEYSGLSPSNASDKLPEIEAFKKDLHFDSLMKFVNRSTVNIKKGAERTTEIIEGLRTFSRIDDHKTVVSSIHENLNNTLLLLHNQYSDRISIEKKYGDIPPIECYPGKLSQVFVNIISNAIQAIEEEGKITISTRKQKKDHIEIVISDTGKGMEEAVAKKIFEPFYTTKEVGKGTGLGLSISHSIIEDHNGSIKVRSKVNQGSEFVIELPVKQDF